MCSGGVVRPIISAFRAEDSGSNPGRSILKKFVKIFNGFYVSFVFILSGGAREAKGDRLRTC